MVKVKKHINRSDTNQPTKRKQKSEKYLAYQRYIRTKKFKEVKHICEERDGGKCMFCGRTRKDGAVLTCHHRCYEHLFEGGNSEAEDCITMCSVCHKALHRIRINYSWFSQDNERNNNEKEKKDE